MARPLFTDPDYVQGQIEALHALILAIAGRTMDKDDFREQGLARLESARNHLLFAQHSEAALSAIDVEERWLKDVTS